MNVKIIKSKMNNEDLVPMAFYNVQKQSGILDNKLSEILKKHKQTPAKSIGYFAKKYPLRDDAMANAYMTGAYSMKEIGDCFKVLYVTVSRAVKKYEWGKIKCTM